MIPVKRATKPPSFDAQVRAPGLSAIAELVGEPPTIRRKGPRRKKVASRRTAIPADAFPPFWRRATKDLLASYGRVCAYACLYIWPMTGSATVDHWAPKSRRWDRVYEWENYRLACSLINSRKREYGDVIDPFEVTDGMFALDLVSLSAYPGPRAGKRRAKVRTTIKRLGLDSAEYARELEEYFNAYMDGHLDLAQIERRAPFLAGELRRQGKLRVGDA
ncbi:MAG: hypothetical protein KIT58_12165 [Planctomycetota bacterium]|nr:hypothetical protein [Planctomycetota bacterium]